jgi:hypothetical protein
MAATLACLHTTATRRRTPAARFAGRAHVVLSNPDMVHSGILPHHPRWAKLFENLKFVIIDELHSYRGVFGSHLANIIRRLQARLPALRIDPTFICSSATIANPRELAERLTGEPFELVDKSGAPRGEKFFLFVNPPVVNAQLGIRRSYLAETRRVAIEFLKRGLAGHRLRAEPALHGNPDDVYERCVSGPGRWARRAARRCADRTRRAFAAIAAAICRCAAGRSSEACAAGKSAVWCPRMRWSLASISARSMWR